MTANLEQRAIEAALETWRALPDDERNGERSYIMGFNAGWEEAESALKGQSASSGWEGIEQDRDRYLTALLNISAYKTGGPHRSGQIKAEHRIMIQIAREALPSPPEPAAPELG